jgi:hypothetical protein
MNMHKNQLVTIYLQATASRHCDYIISLFSQENKLHHKDGCPILVNTQFPEALQNNWHASDFEIPKMFNMVAADLESPTLSQRGHDKNSPVHSWHS